MSRASRSFFFAFLLFPLLCFVPPTLAETGPNAELEGIIRKMEERHYRWIAIRAEVTFFFAGSGNASTMCRGELLYQRLDEHMFLSCVNTLGEMVFAFRTMDRRFDLYLPTQKKVYHGSIFDLEDSPDIESHLKARDLYRALKPLTVDPRRTKVERANDLVTQLDVYTQKGAEGPLLRRLYLTPEGDVRSEIYYGANGRSVTEIQRYDFVEFKGRSGSYDSIIFPKKITLISPETQKGSAIFFSKVTPLDTIDPLEFIFKVPPGTEEIFLEEKDPRFDNSKGSSREARPVPETARSQTSNTSAATVEKDRPKTYYTSNELRSHKAPVSAPAPRSKEIPVYLAKAREVPEEKTTPAPIKKKEKETPQAPPPVAAPVAPPAAAISTEPVKTETVSPATAQTPPDQPPATNNQTTLDPSVDPSMDMGKQ